MGLLNFNWDDMPKPVIPAAHAWRMQVAIRILAYAFLIFNIGTSAYTGYTLAIGSVVRPSALHYLGAVLVGLALAVAVYVMENSVFYHATGHSITRHRQDTSSMHGELRASPQINGMMVFVHFMGNGLTWFSFIFTFLTDIYGLLAYQGRATTIDFHVTAFTHVFWLDAMFCCFSFFFSLYGIILADQWHDYWLQQTARTQKIMGNVNISQLSGGSSGGSAKAMPAPAKQPALPPAKGQNQNSGKQSGGSNKAAPPKDATIDISQFVKPFENMAKPPEMEALQTRVLSKED